MITLALAVDPVLAADLSRLGARCGERARERWRMSQDLVRGDRRAPQAVRPRRHAGDRLDDEVRRIAANIVRLPGLLLGYWPPPVGPGAIDAHWLLTIRPGVPRTLS